MGRGPRRELAAADRGTRVLDNIAKCAAAVHRSPCETKLKRNLHGSANFCEKYAERKSYIMLAMVKIDECVAPVGNAYERGFAHGSILKNDTAEFYSRVYPFLNRAFYKLLTGLSHGCQRIASWIAKVGLGVALDATYDITEKYTGQWFKDEMKGLADGSGVDEKYIRRVHMIGELTQGHCSMYGAWGAATATGATLQLRALDWDTGGPFQDYPQITVYHAGEANDEEGHSFANVGWVGWIGSISGISSKQMAISEIGVSFPDKSFGKTSREGVPFTFLLRDILQFDNSLDNAIDHIKNAHRTCDLILGVGDGKPQANTSSAPFRGIQYSHSVANFYDDTEYDAKKRLVACKDTSDGVLRYGLVVPGLFGCAPSPIESLAWSTNPRSYCEERCANCSNRRLTRCDQRFNKHEDVCGQCERPG